MAFATQSNAKLSVKAYRGDARTLLAFNMKEADTTRLAGFTIQCAPAGVPAFYLQNTLQFEDPSKHSQDAKEPPNSSINAPFHKFRWIHVPGSVHQGVEMVFGQYTYTVTPRYFDAGASLLPLDSALSVTLSIEVGPFLKGDLALGFTRGYTQSQAFVHHFGPKALIAPKNADLLFDTSVEAGANAQGDKFTYEQEYQWLGFTARTLIFDLLDELAGSKLTLDMFAYDLNEPDLMQRLIDLAGQGRVRMILDNAALHHSTAAPTHEDEFEKRFRAKMAGDSDIKRGHFKRYSHDKVLIVSDAAGPLCVLTGSTNFSLTGLYVNSNHVLRFDNRGVAAQYSEVFNAVWDSDVTEAGFVDSVYAQNSYQFASATVPQTEIMFSPHDKDHAAAALGTVVDRIDAEIAQAASGSVLFAVMETDNGVSPVYQSLTDLYKNTNIFSAGISDSTAGIRLYEPKTTNGLKVTGKPGRTVLPPPFDQVPAVAGHQVHHKFVVCGFNRPDAVVFCGSSNLALGGEQENGDNLLAIHDTDVATVFAIEALGLVDHFQFLNRQSQNPKIAPQPAPVSKTQAAVDAKWFLSTTDNWKLPYFDKTDLHYVDRELFA